MTDEKRPLGDRSDDSVTTEQEGDPKNVGKSVGRRGEEAGGQKPEKGHHHTGTKGKSDRPTGKSTARGSTGIDPQEPRDDDSPTSQRGGG